jgi:hypothetical protein
VVTAGIVVVAMMMVVWPSLRVRSNQTKYCRRSHDSTLHGYSLLEERSRFGDQEAADGRHQKQCQSGAVRMSGSTSAVALKKSLVTKMGHAR